MTNIHNIGAEVRSLEVSDIEKLPLEDSCPRRELIPYRSLPTGFRKEAASGGKFFTVPR